ncbi:hypothetical protein U729_2545 [Clostridium baratii str. Sullivan]|uniref:Uncharacterized protein n=1 Tax=Clostridium baratii str. Sullivan TaxID=1415775 RepID=A0A0A7FSN0_9CLOT|nr:hypothetical protein [Clostridium baratii]AIY82644.1 hypothetical protein U729_2545 [Clostridium baratii str. Sullivan]MDU1055095.1 hypothetical protein [Clostridium baratii]
MFIKAVTVPTPRRIKKYLKDKCTKERILVYSLIGGGIMIISLGDLKLKDFPIFGLLYLGFAYEVIEHTDDEILNSIYRDINYNNIYNLLDY